MSLKLDWAVGGDGTRAIPVVFKEGMIHDELVIQVDGRASSHLDDPESVPLADRLVGSYERVLAGCSGAVVPQTAGAFVGLQPLDIIRVGEVPDLNLRGPTEIDTAISLRADLEVDQELDVAVIFVGRQVNSLAVVDDHPVFHSPMLLQIFGAFGEHLGFFVRRKCVELARVHRLQAVPARKVLAVEEWNESLGRSR